MGFAVAAFLNLNVIAITIIATGLGFVAMYSNKNGNSTDLGQEGADDYE